MGPSDGTSYLDLAGNRVVWSNDDHETIVLAGSKFQSILLMATLAISALCLLCFLAMFMAYCCMSCCGRTETKTNLPFKTVFVPLFCMIAFFVVDISNRVMHEMQTTISSAYLGIDVGIGSLSNIADGCLQTYLLKHSPIDIKQIGWTAWIVMTLAVVVYALASIGTRGTQIWSVIAIIAGSDDSKDQYWQYAACAAAATILLYAIGWTIFAISFLRNISPDHASKKRLEWGIAMLAATFLGRNIVVFVFYLLYSQFAHVAGYGVQLAYLSLYGLLSVVIWTCILLVAGCHEEREAGNGVRPTPLEQNMNEKTYGQQNYVYTYGSERF